VEKDFLDFFKELIANNHRDWFHANKKRYEKAVKEPFKELVVQLIERMKTEEEGFELEPKNAIFRINRDIRFSKDKTPYKTFVSAVISKGGRKNLGYPGIYLQIGPEGSYIGGGCHSPDKHQLHALRTAISQDYDRVMGLLEDKEFKSYFPDGIKGDRNKILPKDFKALGADQPFLFQKQFYYMTHYADETTSIRPDLTDFIMEHYQASKGWTEFIRETLFSQK